MEDEEMTEFERKMQEVLFKKQFVIKRINELVKEYEDLDQEEKRLEVEEFGESGIAFRDSDPDDELTDDDKNKDLIKRTEGKMIKPKKPNKN